MEKLVWYSSEAIKKIWVNWVTQLRIEIIGFLFLFIYLFIYRICMTKVKDVLRMMKIKKAVGPDEIIEV